MEESSAAAATSMQKKVPVAGDDDHEYAGRRRMPYNPFISLEDGSPCNDRETVAVPFLSPVAVEGTSGQRDHQAAADVRNNGECWCHPALEPFVHPTSVLSGFESKCSLENSVAPALTTTGTSN